MRLLIDGYNLLYQTSALRPGDTSKRALHNARARLLSLLNAWIDSELHNKTIVVFDAKDAPEGLPDVYVMQGITVQFARDWDSADASIQDLIQRHSSPKSLTVVSSDHAIHRKAIARGATIVDSDVWIDQMEQRAKLAALDKADLHEHEKPDDDSVDRDAKLTDDERKRWLDEFGY